MQRSLPAIFLAGVTAQLRAPLICGEGGPSYSVSLDGGPMLPPGSPLHAFSGGAWVTSWALLGGANVSGSDGLGSYTGVDCTYARGDDPAAAPFISVSLYEYPAAAAWPAASLLRFRYALPGGASATNFSAAKGHHATITNFPAFAGGKAPLLPRSITWQDSFVAPQRNNVAYGMAGGPLLSHGDDVSGRVTIFSPLDQFLTSALGDDPGGGGALCGDGATGCFTAGAASSVQALPPGFVQSWLLLAELGITNTVAAWGAVMRAEYGATSSNLADPSLTTLGYQTDNGAQLCFGCPGQVLDKCLLEEKALLDAAHIPIQYLSFQNAWWKSGGESAPWCVGEWEAVPAKVPMGIPAFQKAMGVPLQLYAPYFCATSTYPNNFSMIRSDTTLPGCNGFDFYDASPEGSRAFYDYLFDLGASYGMTMFEPDFLNQNHNCMPQFISQVGAAEGFFGGQAAAALARGIPIQWCFCTPYLLLWTLNAPAVTNFRVSYDFYYGGSWDIGVSSLIVFAMGKAPSKDTFWTSDNGDQATTRGGCDRTGCPADHSSPAAELHTALALLSTGPVGFSDAPNETDATLILRTCDSGGNLLQPSRPITAVDSTFALDGAPSGYVLATHTAVTGRVAAWTVVGHSLTAPYGLKPLDLWPRPVSGAAVGVATLHALRDCGGGTGAACGVQRSAVATDGTTPLFTLPAVAAGVDPFTPDLRVVAPLCTRAGDGSGAGAAFFGEPQKLAPVSTRRFPALACDDAGQLTFTAAGEEGEQITVAWAAWGATGDATVIVAPLSFAGRRMITCVIAPNSTTPAC